MTPLILVLQSLVDFGKGNFQDCLKHLKQVISMNPRSPPSIWLGIGLCYYRLGNTTKALFTFQRVLDYEPGNVLANNAIVIISNMGDHILRDEEHKQKNATNLSRSYQTDKNNPLTLKLVAEHFFQMGQYDKAQSACEQALKVLESYRASDSNSARENPNFRKDIEYLKSDIHFVIGKIHHVKKNFTGA
jgi:RNA polymerase-associated protein CTR9